MFRRAPPRRCPFRFGLLTTYGSPVSDYSGRCVVPAPAASWGEFRVEDGKGRGLRCTVEPVPDHIADAVGMIKAAYPDGLPKEDYRPLLIIFGHALTERTLGYLFELCGYSDRWSAPNDRAAILSDMRMWPADDDKARVFARLGREVFEDWLGKYEIYWME